MTFLLTVNQIDDAMPKIQSGLTKYLWLQKNFDQGCSVSDNLEFRRKFNHFYKVRRGISWQNKFYDLMDRAKRETLDFRSI
jgi:hypothetical protein